MDIWGFISSIAIVAIFLFIVAVPNDCYNQKKEATIVKNLPFMRD